MRRIPIVLVALTLVVTPGLVRAQVTNGDFEAGNTGWTTDPCPGWTFSFLAAGGNPNGYATIHSPFGNSAGLCSIRQQFVCGVAGDGGTCNISFDFKLDRIDASSLTGRVKVIVDGAVVFVSPAADNIPWTLGAAQVPCGVHEIQLALEVDPGNNGWLASFDNVTARCEGPLGAAPRTWGMLKALYQ